AGHPQAVASSAPMENVEVTIEELGIRDCFGAIVSGDDVTRGKPHPQVFTTAAGRLGVKPIDCIVVEDAVVGVQAGIRAGMTVYAVTNTRRREELYRADRIVDSLEELTADDFVLP
ncbi:MAG: HAD-IA family hydrolase, partial [Chloroflexota bacterium]|nr:HAD-IA family hydrolase [Chloroflexota bacterium]